ncbi:MAG: hypothetical protein JWL98_248 [Xanthomonadaceae bacterium]|nr:hypothetical protein [Xanthomonadaceae bacterium]
MDAVLTSPKTAGNDEPAWVGDVLHFWFAELSEQQWWRKDEMVDARIRERFLRLHEDIVAQHATGAVAPRSALATVIVLDQFPRNMFRGDARMYATDPLARRIARAAIDAGLDRDMDKQERLFLYMPLQHSEDAADQRLGVDLTAALGDDALTRFALAHQHIVDRFGRFPHRNAILGRVSTDEELASLQEPMGSF